MANNFKTNPNPIDPDVKVPAAVRRAAEAAEAAMSQAYPADPNAIPLPTDPNDAPAPPNNDTIVIVEANPVQKLPQQVTAQPTPTEVVPPVVGEETWEQRYKSMHGQFRRSEQLLRESTARIEALENMLASAGSAPRQDAPAPTAAAKLITQKEEEEFGPEMLDIMRRAARETAGPEIDSLKATVQDLQTRIAGTTQVVTQDARARMLATLDQQLPEWGEINMMDEFKSWLALPDAYSGAKRHKLLTEAYEQNQTSRVLAFFKGFVSELAATQPPEPSAAPASAPRPSKPTLEALAAPGRARTAASVTPAAEKQIIYTSDINAFYKAKRDGRYNGREAEFLQAERELELAMKEGRVVTNT